MIDDVADLQALEVDAGHRFRALGMDEIADDDPPATELLEAHVGNSNAWVAVEPDGRIVGYALASMVDGEGHLDQVSVADDAGRRGIGTALIEQVCSWTRRQGAVSVTLTTFRDVAFNGPYYESLGFIALDESQCGPELAAIRDNEIDLGLDIAPRVAMRRRLDHPVGRPPVVPGAAIWNAAPSMPLRAMPGIRSTELPRQLVPDRLVRPMNLPERPMATALRPHIDLMVDNAWARHLGWRLPRWHV